MIELRGIITHISGGTRRVRLVTRNEQGSNYETLEFPSGLPLNEGQIRKFLGDHYGMEPGHIIWPDHVKIPEV